MAAAKCKKVIREDGRGIDFNFINGHVLEVIVDDMPQDIKSHLMLHGASQKVGDSFAGAETVEECIEAATAVFEQLRAGQWKAQRESTGGSAPRSSQLVEALVAITGKSAADINAMLDSKTEDERKAIRKHPQVAAQLAAIAAQRAADRAAKAQQEAQGSGSLF